MLASKAQPEGHSIPSIKSQLVDQGSMLFKSKSLGALCGLWGGLCPWFAIYIICLLTSCASPLKLFFSSLFSYLSFPLRICRLRFQAGGRKRLQNLGSFSCFSLFYVLVFLCFRCMIICVLFASVYCIFLWLLLLVFGFCFLSTSREIGWEQHFQNDLFYVQWDVKP